MVATLLWRLCTRSSSRYWLVKSQVVYRQILGGLGRGSRIINPLRFECPSYIYLGERVTVNRFCWLGAYPQKGFDRPRLSIGDGSQIGHFNHITCINDVEIGPNVLTADRVHISDNEHIFENVSIPVMKQGVTSRSVVAIGEGTWIGENANVLSCKVGRNCVIGANAVVISDIPDFSVAVGVPARVVKRYDPGEKRWTKVSVASRDFAR